MPNAIVIPSGGSLLDAVASRLESEGADFSRTAVVFPGQRPAHFLRKAMAARIGRAFVPPRTFSYDDFGTFLATEQLGDNARTLEVIDAAALLYETHLAIDDRFGAEHFQTIDQFLPLALRLYDELEELQLGDLSASEIQAAVGGLSYGRHHTIAAYYAMFYDRVRDRGVRTPASRLRWVAENIEKARLDTFRRVIVAGFFGLTAVDRRIFRSLADREETVMIFQEGPGLGKHLKKLGISWESAEMAERPEPPRVRLCKASDRHGQIFALAQELQGELDAGAQPDERTVIVVPSAEAIVPVIHHVLPMLEGGQYNISLRYPIARTPAYGFLSSLLSVMTSVREGKIAVAKYVEFLQHPYVKSIRFGPRRDATRVLVHAIEDHVRWKRSGVSMTLEQFESASAVFQAAVRALSAEGENVTTEALAGHLRWIHDNTIRRFWEIRSLNDFARASSDVLLFIHEHSTADFHPLFRPYVDKLVDIFRICSTSLLSGYSFGGPSAYQRFLKEYVGRMDVPFPGTPLGGLQVLGMLETRSVSFDRAYVLDASDDVVPGARGEGTFLPQELRQALGLQTFEDREMLSEYHLDLLRRGAREVTFYFSENGKKEKSRFLEKLIWEWEQRDGKPDDGRSVESVRYTVHLSNPSPGPVVKTEAMVVRLRTLVYSASSLDRYLKCPLRFYYADVLKLRERRGLRTDPDQLDVGAIVHEVLRELYEESRERPLLPEAIAEGHLEAAAERVFQSHFGSPVPARALLIKRQVQLQLGRFLREYQKPMLERGPITILGLEVPVATLKSGFAFEGRIDRIERRAESVVILDYKTGKDDTRFAIRPEKLDLADPDTWPDAVGSVQLPMYRMLYQAQHHEPGVPVIPAYLILGKKDLREGVEVGIGSLDGGHDELYTLLEGFILHLVERICESNVPFKPASNLRNSCPECAYQTLCGTQWLRARGDA